MCADASLAQYFIIWMKKKEKKKGKRRRNRRQSWYSLHMLVWGVKVCAVCGAGTWTTRNIVILVISRWNLEYIIQIGFCFTCFRVLRLRCCKLQNYFSRKVYGHASHAVPCSGIADCVDRRHHHPSASNVCVCWRRVSHFSVCAYVFALLPMLGTFWCLRCEKAVYVLCRRRRRHRRR